MKNIIGEDININNIDYIYEDVNLNFRYVRFFNVEKYNLGKKELLNIFVFVVINYFVEIFLNIYLGDDILPQILFLIIFIILFITLYSTGVKISLFMNIIFGLIFMFSSFFHLASYFIIVIETPFTLIINLLPILISLMYLVYSFIWLKTLILSKNTNYYLIETQIKFNK